MGKASGQLASSGVTLEEFFPQLRQLILAAASEHETFQDDVHIDPDDELPVLDDIGNRSIIMRPGSEAYSNQQHLGGTHKVHTVSSREGRLEGFAVQARVQILGFPSSLIRKKQRRRGPGGRRSPQHRTTTNISSPVRSDTPGIERICILRWRLSSAAATAYESSPRESRENTGRSDVVAAPVSSRRGTPPSPRPGVVQKTPRTPGHATRDPGVRTSSVDNLLNTILGDSDAAAATQGSTHAIHSLSRLDNAPSSSTSSGEPRTPTSIALAAHGSDNREDVISTAMAPNSASYSGNLETKEGSGLQGVVVEAHESGIEKEIGLAGEYRIDAKNPALGGTTATYGSVHSFSTHNLKDEFMDNDHLKHEEGAIAADPEGKQKEKNKGVRWDEGSVIKGNRSVDTGGTGSTASSGLSVLRSHLDGTQRRIMEPALKALRNTVILVLTLASLLAVGSAVMNSFTLRGVTSSLDGVELSGDRLYYAADTALHVQELLWMWAGDLDATDDVFAQSQVDLENVAAKLEREHKSLYLNATAEEVSITVAIAFPAV